MEQGALYYRRIEIELVFCSFKVISCFWRVGVVLKRTEILCGRGTVLGSLSTDPAGQLDVLRHDGLSLGVDGTQVGVFEDAD